MPRTGPRTPEGKAVVRLNARKHGLFVADVVIPGIEDPRQWQAFREAIVSDLAPEGAMETMLAERMAEVAWRRRRIAVAEAQIIAVAIEEAPDNYARAAGWREAPTSVDEARALFTATRAALDLIPRLASLRPTDLLDPDACNELLEAAAGVQIELLEELSALPEHPRELAAWDVALLQVALANLAELRGCTSAALLEAAAAALRDGLARRQQDITRTAAGIDRSRRGSLLPDATRLGSIDRHESRLDRAFDRAWLQLQMLQARRQGEHFPINRVEFIGHSA